MGVYDRRPSGFGEVDPAAFKALLDTPVAPYVPSAPAPGPETGYIEGAARSLIRGIADIPVQAGHAAQWNEDYERSIGTDANGRDESQLNMLNRAGKKVAEIGADLRDSIDAPNFGSNEVKRSVFQGVESLPVSVAYGIPSTAGAIIGGGLGVVDSGGAASIPQAIAGAAAGQALAAPIMFRAQAQDTADALRKQNIDHNVATDAAKKAGHAEWQGEAISDIPEALIYSRIPGLKAGVKTARELLKPGMKQFLKNYAMSLPAEQLGEGYTAYRQADVVNDVMPQDQQTSPWQAVKEQAGPTAVMTLLMGGAGTGLQRLRSKHIATTLENPEAEPDKRYRAAAQVAELLKDSQAGETAANNFLNHAALAIGDEQETGSKPYALDLTDPALLEPVQQAEPAAVEPAPTAPVTVRPAQPAPTATISTDPEMAAPGAGIVPAQGIAERAPIAADSAPKGVIERAVSTINNPYQAFAETPFAAAPQTQPASGEMPIAGANVANILNGIAGPATATAPAAAPAAAIKPQEELLLDEARSWAKSEIQNKNTSVMKMIGETQNNYNRRILDSYLKSQGQTASESENEKSLYSLVDNWQRRNRDYSPELMVGEMEANPAFRSAEADGSTLQAHGMAKSSPAKAARDLVNLFRNGIDNSTENGRRGYLDSAPLTARSGEGLTGATASGTAYRDGAFVLVARDGVKQIRNISDIAGVLVNPSIGENVAKSLQSIVPSNVMVRTYHDVADVVSHAKQKQPALVESQPVTVSVPQQRKQTVNPEKDDLVQAIAKLGGLDKDQVSSQWGPTVAEQARALNRRAFGGALKKGGQPLDVMAQKLAEHGYLPTDENGKVDPREFEAAMQRAAAGEKVLSSMGQARRAETMQRDFQPDMEQTLQPEPFAFEPQGAAGKWKSLKEMKAELGGMKQSEVNRLAAEYAAASNFDISGWNMADKARFVKDYQAWQEAQAIPATNRSSAAVQPIGGMISAARQGRTTTMAANDGLKGAVNEVSQLPEVGGQGQKEMPDLRNGNEEVAQPLEGGDVNGRQEVLKTGEPSPAPAAAVATIGANNTLFTQERADRARAILRSKLNQLNSGLDPEMVTAGIDLAGYYVEAGFRSFAEYSGKMIEDLGEAVKPYLKSWYLAIRHYPGFDNAGMETEEAVLKAEPARPVERRKNTEKRRQLEAMTQEELRRELFTDPMTGLGNKRAFLEVAKRPHQAYIDADDLKYVNDTYGHQTGDALLVAVGEAIAKETKMGYHLSGDEFALHADTVETLQSMLGRIVKTLSTVELKADGKVVKTGIGISYGIGATTEEADKAMQQHKKERTERGERGNRGEKAPDKVTPAEPAFDHAAETKARNELQARWDAANDRATALGTPAALAAQDKFENGDLPVEEFERILDEETAQTPAAKFAATRKRHIEKKLAAATSAKEKARLGKLLETLKEKTSLPTKATDSILVNEKVPKKEGIAYADTENNGRNDAGNEPTSRQGTRTRGDEATAGNEERTAAGSGDRTSADVAEQQSQKVQEPERGGAIAANAEEPGAVPEKSAGDGDRPVLELPVVERENGDVRAPTHTVGTGDNFTITNELDFSRIGQKTKYRNNVEAIRTLRLLEKEGRPATPEEQAKLARYVGWGGIPQAFDAKKSDWAGEYAELKELLSPEEYQTAISSTRNAHYTAAEVVNAMWQAVQRLGFTRGNVLEPSMGVGNFFGLMPKGLRVSSKLQGIEFDHITGTIAKYLYPKARVNITGFQDIKLQPNSYDLAIGNPPFGAESLYDKNNPAISKFKIHGFFFAKSLESLRPGGVLAMVVSKGLLDATDATGVSQRQWLSQRAKLLGAIRLPDTAFKANAGTDVTTDIVFLQKLQPGETTDYAWTEMGEIADRETGGSIRINKYFIEHPEMMLGEMTLKGKMYHGSKETLSARPGDDLSKLLNEALATLPEKIITVGAHTTASLEQSAREGLAKLHEVRPYNYFMEGDTLYQRMPDLNGEATATPVNLDGKALERVKGMLDIRDTVRRQLRLESSPSSNEKQIEFNRKRLNAIYDGFVKKYGHLNSQTNKRLFKDDADSPLVISLEKNFDKGVSREIAKKTNVSAKEPTAKKADIFSKRVLTPSAEVTKVASADEALTASINERGGIDFDYMQDIYGKDTETIKTELGEQIFEDPRLGWQPRDAYLSGNVKTKLAEAIRAANEDPKYRRNVDALEAVQPKDIPAADITVAPHSFWIPEAVFGQFAQETFDGRMSGGYQRSIGRFNVQFSSGNTTLNEGKYGTARMPATSIMAALMANRQVAVYDSVPDGNGGHKQVLNPTETAAAQGKADELAEAFQDWIWKDADRRQQLSRIYNDTFNTNVDRKYDGAHLTLPGMSSAIELRPHQKNGVYRVLQTGVTLFDHVVGAGKTFAIAASAMEQRRLGMARKPMITVPNHLVEQWAKEFKQLYPGANILAATRKDFEKNNRRLLFSKIATGDWDMVIVAHSSFKFIPVPRDVEAEIMNEQLREIVQAIEEAKREKGSRFTIKDLERTKIKIEEKLKKLADAPKDDLLDFSELGVDALYVDEAHEFKNLFYTTTMQNVAGLGNQSGSSRAFDMFVKTQYLMRRNGGKGVFFATGTPVSNSLAEVFHMQRFLQYDELKARGLHNFDAWASTFGQATSDWEQDAGGRFKQKTRFRKLVNLPELKQLWGEVADTITRPDLMRDAEAQGKRFPLPKIEGGKPKNVVVERSPQQAQYIGIPREVKDDNGDVLIDKENGQPVVAYDPGTVIYRMEHWVEAVKGGNTREIPLVITGDARKAGLDFRLIDENSPDFAGSKVNTAVSEIYDIWKQNDARRGTQLVFIDLSTPKKHKGKALEKMAEKVPTYFLKKNGGIEHVQGKPLQLSAMPEAEFFSLSVGKGSSRRFVVYEKQSGLHVGDGPTLQEAKDFTNARLAEMPKERFLEEVSKKAIPQEQIDEYVERWEEAQSQKEEEGGVDDEKAPEQEISLDEILADSGSSNFSVYDDIKEKLLKKGVPANQVVFIHDYDTDIQKADLFNKMNNGEVRVLLGSTPKMGAGTNVQKKLVALHHLDAPWKPSDLEQREGRIIRQGNEFYEQDPDGFEIKIRRYATKQTYDSRMWEIIETKAKSIELFKSGGKDLREVEDVSSESANAAEIKASSAGNPLMLEDLQLKNEIKKLEAQEKSWRRSRYDQEDLVKKVENETAYPFTRLIQLEALQQAVKPADRENLGLKLGKDTFQNKEDLKSDKMFAHLKEALDESNNSGSLELVPVGEYRGATIYVKSALGEMRISLAINGKDIGASSYGSKDNFSASGFITRLDNIIAGIPHDIADAKTRIERLRKEAAAAKEELKQEFKGAEKLKELKGQHRKVIEALRKGKTSIETDDTASFALGNKTTGIKAADIDKSLAPILKNWKNAPNVTVVQSVEKLPARALMEIFINQYDPKSIQAVFVDGGVHLVADNLSSVEEAQRKLLHEVKAHFGLRAVMGNPSTFEKTMLQADLYYRAKKGDVYRKIAKAYGYDLKNRADRIKAAEEMIAHEAETGGTSTFLSRVVAAVKDFLRQIGITVQMGEAEIRELLASAERFLAGEESGVQMSGATRFAAAWHGSPHSFDKFSTENIGTGEGAQAYGYGLYFAGSKDVAEFYKRKLGDFSVTVNDKPFDADKNTGIEASAISQLLFDTNKTSIDAPTTIARLEKLVAGDFLSDDGKETVRKQIEWIRKNADAVKVGDTGRLYQVELAPQEDEYLLWDKPLSEQSDKIKSALDSANFEVQAAGDPFGNSIYDMAASYMGTEKEMTGGWVTRIKNDKAASAYLHSLGIRGIKYLDGSSRNKPLRDIKRNFLDALPEDATFDEVMELVGTGQFTPEQERVLKALESDDWLGFDYPSQAISNALSDRLAGFEASPELTKAVDALSKDATYNYVIFNDQDVEITARFALNQAMNAVPWQEVTDYARSNWQSILNPLDWSRTAKFFDDWTPTAIKAGIGYVAANPHFEAERDAAKRPLVEEGAEREINRMKLMLSFFGYEPGEGDTRTVGQQFKDFFTKWHSGQESTEWEGLNQRYAKLDKQQNAAINTLAVQGDVNNTYYSSYRNAMMNKKIKAAGLTEETFNLYRDVYSHMQRVSKLREQWTEHMMLEAGIPKAVVDKHISDYRNTVRQVHGWLSRNHGNGEYAVSVHHVVRDLPFTVREVAGEGQQAFLPFYPGVRAMKEIEKLAGEATVTLTGKGAVVVTAKPGESLDEFMAGTKDIIPQIGPQKVKVYARYHTMKGMASRHANQVRANLKEFIPENFREGEKYEVSHQQVEVLTEEIYQNMKSDMAMEAGLQKAFDKAFKTGDIDREELDSLKDNLVLDTAEMLLGRAAGKYQIRRAPNLIEGYDTDNLMANYQDYMTSVAGLLSKADYARRQFAHMKKASIGVKPWAYKYVFDSLRNMGLGDRISGNLRAFVSLWYMGLKPATALINATQIYTIGVADLGRVMPKGQSAIKAIARAQRDTFAGKLTKDEKLVFDSAIIRQQEAASAMAQITGHNEGSTGKAGKLLHNITGKTMALFQNVEILNRKTMILAAYRTLRNDNLKEGEVDEKALKQALDINNSVNFDQGRHNLPGWARTPVGHTLYALQSFTWNNFNWIYNRATSGEKRDMVAMLRYTGMLMLIGGAGALAGGDELDKLYRKLRGKSLMLEAKMWTQQHAKEYGTLGDIANAFAWNGLGGVAGVNISNSIRLQMPVVSQMIGDATMPEAFAGVYAGLFKKAWLATEAASHGDLYRAAESAAPEAIAGPMRAYRQYDKGMTTLKGKPVFDEHGQPLKYSKTDAALRMAGFQPAEQSKRMAVAQTAKELQAYWKDRRDNLLTRMRTVPREERSDVTRDIIRFNKELRDSQAFGLVNTIKAETIKRALTAKPDKRKLKFSVEAMGD